MLNGFVNACLYIVVKSLFNILLDLCAIWNLSPNKFNLAIVPCQNNCPFFVVLFVKYPMTVVYGGWQSGAVVQSVDIGFMDQLIKIRSPLSEFSYSRMFYI